MTLLLDTCVVSEAIKPQRDRNVAAWLAGQSPDRLHISAITLGELHMGAQRHPSGKRQRELESWVAIVESDFSERIIPVDETVAVRWGHLRARHPNAPIIDSQIAATAMTYGLTLVTRNVKDFAFTGLSVFNPWRK